MSQSDIQDGQKVTERRVTAIDDINKSHNTHLIKHDRHLQGALDAKTANDYPYGHDGDAHFNPGVARTNVAATIARPDGTTEDDWAEKHKDMTVMQQHAVRLSFSLPAAFVSK